WGPCAVWVDAEKNYICISDFLDQILYISSKCPYTETLSGILEKYHGVDLQGTLEKVGNTEGI
ncbi:MAG: hypothetical protein LUC90_05705, partial [Lachnospiraceae bacterium]|nr:hypothetical protein [Lachnospiraceae bacterium]